MKRIFIDTNILISAIVFDKKELELIIRCVSERYKICISEHILEEATRVFMKKFTEFIEMYEKFIGITKIEVIKKKSYDYNIKEHQNIRDKYDAHVIACAESSSCEFIISGDKDILSYEHSKIKIVKSAEFIKHLKKN